MHFTNDRAIKFIFETVLFSVPAILHNTLHQLNVKEHGWSVEQALSSKNRMRSIRIEEYGEPFSYWCVVSTNRPPIGEFSSILAYFLSKILYSNRTRKHLTNLVRIVPLRKMALGEDWFTSRESFNRFLKLRYTDEISKVLFLALDSPVFHSTVSASLFSPDWGWIFDFLKKIPIF